MDPSTTGVPLSVTLKMENGDLALDSGGRHINIQGAEKLSQDTAESLLNNFDPEFPSFFNGSELFAISEDPIANNDIGIQQSIHSSVEEAVSRLQDMQDLDPYTDDDERIDEILDLDVRKHGTATWSFFLLLQVDSDDQIPLDFEINLLNQLPSSLRDQVFAEKLATAALPKSFL